MSVTSVVEPLERRQLLSASVTGAFLGSVPSALLAGKLNNRVTVRVSNTSGAREAGKVSVGLHVSTTPDLQGDAVLVGTASRNLRMRPGQAADFPFHFASPSALPDGSDYLVAKIDGPAAVDGTASEAIVVAPQAVSVVRPFADLTGQAIGPSAPIVEMGLRAAHGLMRVSVTNIGNAPAKGPMQIAADLSGKSTFDAGAMGIGSVSLPAMTIKPGGTRTFRVPLTIPAGTPGGTYTLFANINPARRIAESDYANDVVTANGPLLVVSPTTTLGAGGGNGGYASDGSGFNIGVSPPPITIINRGGNRTNVHVIPRGGAPAVQPPYVFGGGGGGGTTTGDDGSGDNGAACGGDNSGSDTSNCDNSGGDTSGGDSSDNGTGGGDTSGTDTSDGGDPGSDTPGTNNPGGDMSGTDGNGNDSGPPTDGGWTGDPTNPGGASDPTDSGGDPNAGGDNGSDFGPDPATDPGAGTDFGNPDDGTDSTDWGNSDSGGTDYGSDPGIDSGGDSGADPAAGDSSGSDFGDDVGSDDSSDPGGYADFAVATFKRTAAAKTSRATPPAPVAFRAAR